MLIALYLSHNQIEEAKVRILAILCICDLRMLSSFARFKTEDEAVRMANGTKFGLAGMCGRFALQLIRSYISSIKW